MTIKHAIPKIEWAIEWVIELLYNSVETGSQTSWSKDELETRCGRESHTRSKGPREPRWSFGDQLGIRCSKEIHHLAERTGPLGLRLSSPGERERHKADGHKSGGQYIAVFVQSPTPSHSKTLSNPFRTLTIKWEVYILLKKTSLVLYHCVIVILSAWICIWVYNIRTRVLDFSLEVSEFELQSCYYVHFGTDILGKGMNPLILLSIG